MTTTLDKWEGVVLNASTEVPPTLVLLEETIYPYAYVYEGNAEYTTFTFTTIPFTPASWVAGRLAANFEDEVKKAGGRVMEMRVYVDESLWRPWTNWRIEVVNTPMPVAYAVPMWPAIILIIVKALAIIAILVTLYLTVIGPIIKFFSPKPINEEIKKIMTREILISLIGEMEKKLGKTPTPPEGFEEMTDQQLRDYCDALGAKIVPPGPSIWPWVVGGAAIVGGIFLVAATRKKGGKGKKT